VTVIMPIRATGTADRDEILSSGGDPAMSSGRSGGLNP